MLIKVQKFLVDKLQVNVRLSLIIPFLIFAVIFIITPLVFIFVSAFTPISQVEDGTVLSGDTLTYNNYNLITSASTWAIIWRSVWTGFIAALLATFVGIPYSFMIARSSNSIFRISGLSLIVSPLFILTLVRVLAVRGIATSITRNEALLNNEFFLIIGMIYVYLPFVIIPLYSVYTDMPKNIMNASGDLGFNSFKTFYKIILPYSIKAILSGFILVFLLSATSVGISAKMLPNPSKIQLIGNVVDSLATPANIFKVASVSNVVIIVLILMTGSYGLIYFLPRYIMKKKGFQNV